MKTKIKTPFGYLSDERIVDNGALLCNETNSRRDIDISTITSDDAQKAYQFSSPYGVGYTDHYEQVLISKKAVQKLNASKPERKIKFLEIS